MALWKKILIGIIVVILLAGIGVGTYFIIEATRTNDGEYHKEQYLEEEYKVGEKIVFKTVSQSDKAYTSMKYAIDSGEETALTATMGETKNNPDLNKKHGDYYIDSGTQTIETTDLQSGTHVLTVYVYHDTTRVILFEHVFKITDAA